MAGWCACSLSFAIFETVLKEHFDFSETKFSLVYIVIGLFKNMFRGNSAPVEARSSQLDIGALYAGIFQLGSGGYSWQQSPAILVASLSVLDNSGALLTESRRLGRTSPLLIAYRRVIESGLLTGAPEEPQFGDGVPENVAAAVADVWTEAHDCDRERDLLDRVILDGEVLLMPDGEVIPPDGFEPVMSGPKWNQRVVGYRIGKSQQARMAGLAYLGDRPMGAQRALPWIAEALPPAAGLLNARTGAGHAIGTMAKIAAVIANAAPDRITAGTAARSGLVEDAGPDGPARQPIHAVGVGSVPYLRAGESVDRIQAGPDESSRKYEAQLERDVSAALNMPLSELQSDYSSGSFSNLRMAWVDAEEEKRRRRSWWHRHYRLPMYLDILSTAFAAGRLPRMKMSVMAALKRPTWPGPKRQPPQPEKQAQAMGLLVEKGILDPEDARTQLEN